MMDKYLYDGVVQDYPDLLKLPYLQTQSGRPSKSKVIVFFISMKNGGDGDCQIDVSRAR